MTVETQYNVVKVNELREITVAQGVDELVINDLDSTPLETKKITAENFALSIKDYILPIATEDTLGGVKIGNGLTINPITGVLSNDVLELNDLQDVIILNPEPGQVIRYNGNQWVNQAEGGITKIIAGEGLAGGGSDGEIVLHVNAGPGLSIQSDAVTVNAHKGLQIIDDYIEVKLNPGLVLSNNAITINLGAGLIVDQGFVTLSLGQGLEFNGQNAQLDIDDKGLIFDQGELALNIGRGLTYFTNKLEADLGDNLFFNGNNIDVRDANYNDKGISKFAPIVNTIADLRGTPSYTDDSVNPEFLDKVGSVPTGAVFYFATREVPNGYLFCDGRTVSRAAYPHLWQIIGSVYNTGGENAADFRLPDLRDEFIRGATTTSADAQLGVRSRIVGSTELGRLEQHEHTIDPGDLSLSNPEVGGSVTIPWGAGWTGNYWDPPATKGLWPCRPVNGSMTFQLDGATGGEVTATVNWTEKTNITPPDDAVPPDINETRPRNIALLPCIKY